jgi:hypothetical protein
MNLFKTIAMVGLVGVGVVYGESYYPNAESVFIAAYNPKETPPFKVIEYLRGKDSSESRLALLQAQARLKFSEPCEIIVIAAKYRVGVAPPKAVLTLPSCDNVFMFEIVKKGIVSIEGEDITVQELKKRIKSLDSNNSSTSNSP